MYLGIRYIFLAITFVHIQSKYQLHNKIAVVTGGAKGIGYAIVDNYLKNGAKTVIIVDKNRPRGLQAEKDFNCAYGANRAFFIHGDVTTDLDRVLTILFKKFEYIDILVNNAGILNEFDPKKTITTNALAPAIWSQSFFEFMNKETGGKGGTIMNVASISAYTKDPLFYFYKSSKFAILGLTLGMGHEYNCMYSGVRVFAICPGVTLTDLSIRPQFILDRQKKDYEKLFNITVSQSADHVGKAAALLYKTASTGRAYTIEGGAPPVPSPDRVNVTLSDFLSMLS